jgi:hypothetical protein
LAGLHDLFLIQLQSDVAWNVNIITRDSSRWPRSSACRGGAMQEDCRGKDVSTLHELRFCACRSRSISRRAGRHQLPLPPCGGSGWRCDICERAPTRRLCGQQGTLHCYTLRARDTLLRRSGARPQRGAVGASAACRMVTPVAPPRSSERARANP